MKKTHILKIGAFIGVFLAGFILGKIHTSDNGFSVKRIAAPEEFFLTRSQEGVPLERALLETLLESKKELLAAFQVVFTTAFPKNKEVMVLAEREITQSKKDIELLERWLYEWYGVQVEDKGEAVATPVSAPR